MSRLSKVQKQEAREIEQRRRRHAPSARQLFPVLRERLLDSRQEFREMELVPIVSRSGKKSFREVPRITFGAPTFRNKINERGEHV